MSLNELIHSSLDGASVGDLLSFPPNLMGPHEKRYVSWIREYIIRHGVIPTLTRFRKEFDLFIPAHTEDPISDVYVQTLQAKKKEFTIQFLMEHQSELREGPDPTALIKRLHDELMSSDRSTIQFTTFDRSVYLNEFKSVPYYIPELDRVTGGLGENDFGFLLGRPGTNKTSILEWMAAKWVTNGHKLLFISNENSAEDILGRIDAFIGGWNPLKTRVGGWTTLDRLKIRSVSYVAGESSGEIHIPTKTVETVSMVSALIDEHNPDLTLIDGYYLMSLEGGGKGMQGHEKAKAISHLGKQLCLKKHKPILGTLQIGRKGEGIKAGRDHVSETDAYLMDADVMLAISRLEKETIVETMKNRWGPPTAFAIDVDFPAMMITVKRGIFVEDDDVEF